MAHAAAASIDESRGSAARRRRSELSRVTGVNERVPPARFGAPVIATIWNLALLAAPTETRPVNRSAMSKNLEFVISQEDGRLLEDLARELDGPDLSPPRKRQILETLDAIAHRYAPDDRLCEP